MEIFVKLIVPALIAICALVPAAVGAWAKLAEVLRPLLQRRRLRLAIVSPGIHLDGEIRAFLATLRKQGYRDVTMMRGGASAAGYQAVVLWCPPKGVEAAYLAEVDAAAPDAKVLVLTYEQLQLPRSPRVLLSQSPTRLWMDIAAVAEEIL